MGEGELDGLTKTELVHLILAQAEQLVKLQAEYDALKLKFEKNQKPPTSSRNSSQPPSKDQKKQFTQRSAEAAPRFAAWARET